jgi:HEAT repeat protein
LQAQPQFSFLACYALQRMPNAHVAAALRELVAKRSGRQRVDVIRTLGALRDQQAVAVLAGELKDHDQPIVAAAVWALGTIGGPAADTALAAFEPAAAELRPAVADARLRCAAGLPAGQALAIYRPYLKSCLPQVRAAALVGLLARQPERRTALLLEAIHGSDAALKNVALRQARSGGGAELTAGLAAALDQLPPAGQAAVLDVLQERGDPAALPAVLKLALSSVENVRQAAISALGRLGGSPQVDLLVQAMANEQGPTQVAARNAVGLLRGRQVNSRLMELAGQGPIDVRVEALGALAARGVAAALPLLLRALDAPEPKLQQAAISGLRALAGAKEYPELLRRALASRPDASRQRLQDLLVALYGRGTDPQECVGQLLAALPTATAEGKSLLLGILGATGDAKALAALRQALESPDLELQKTALRSLAQWPDAAPLKRLIAIVHAADTPAMRVLALRAVLAILGREKTVANPQKVALLADLLEHSPRPDEKRLVVAALPKAACVKSLQLAVKLLADSQWANEAAAAVANMAPGFRRAGIPPAQMQAALEKAAPLAKGRAIQEQIRAQLQALRDAAR